MATNALNWKNGKVIKTFEKIDVSKFLILHQLIVSNLIRNMITLGCNFSLTEPKSSDLVNCVILVLKRNKSDLKNELQNQIPVLSILLAIRDFKS